MPGTLKSYKENTFMITKKIFVYCYAFNHSFAQNIFFNEGYFYSRGFQKYSRTSVENSRTFQGYRTIFQFSRTFQGHDAFSRTFLMQKDLRLLKISEPWVHVSKTWILKKLRLLKWMVKGLLNLEPKIVWSCHLENLYM